MRNAVHKCASDGESHNCTPFCTVAYTHFPSLPNPSMYGCWSWISLSRSAERDSGYYCTCGRGHEHDGRTTDGRREGGRFPAPPSISIGRQERDAECRHRIRLLGRLAVNKFHLIYSLVPALHCTGNLAGVCPPSQSGFVTPNLPSRSYSGWN